MSMKKIVFERNFYKKHDIYFGVIALIISLVILQREHSVTLLIFNVIFLVLSLIKIAFSVVSIRRIN